MATGLIYGGISDALTDMFASTGHTFTWKGQSYGCALNVESSTLVTSKDLFNGPIPKVGDVITVVGKNRLIELVSNASATLVAGGYVEPGTTYADDPASPAFSIHYGAFVKG